MKMNEKQEEILRVSKKLFSQKGYMSVSMQSIADACKKISKASIYKLFDSKALLLELIKYNQCKMRDFSDHSFRNDAVQKGKIHKEDQA
ncbi:TetR/AcrR family transcriptional regulator [Bacillus sp. SL00103]